MYQSGIMCIKNDQFNTHIMYMFTDESEIIQ